MSALKPNGGDGNPLSRRRAFVLLKSGRRLDPLNPDPQAWTDEDLAAGLARTPRWSGSSKWKHSLSVAQRSLTVLGAARARRAANVRAILPGSVDPATRGVDIEVCDECRDVELSLIGRLAQANVGEGRVNVRRKDAKEKVADLA